MGPAGGLLASILGLILEPAPWADGPMSPAKKLSIPSFPTKHQLEKERDIPYRAETPSKMRPTVLKVLIQSLIPHSAPKRPRLLGRPPCTAVGAQLPARLPRGPRAGGSLTC